MKSKLSPHEPEKERVGNLNRDLVGVQSKIDSLLEAIGQGVVDHALARRKLGAYKKRKQIWKLRYARRGFFLR